MNKLGKIKEKNIYDFFGWGCLIELKIFKKFSFQPEVV
jgi:hypothetical protein